MEVLVVVVIMGILAVLAVTSMRKYLAGSQRSDAAAMVQAIRAAEERWRAQHLTYLETSPTRAWFPQNPIGQAERTRYGFWDAPPGEDFNRWRALDPAIPGKSEFCFIVEAGAPSEQLPTQAAPGLPALSYPTVNSPDWWYVVQGVADADMDGKPAYVVASSLEGGTLLFENEGE